MTTHNGRAWRIGAQFAIIQAGELAKAPKYFIGGYTNKQAKGMALSMFESMEAMPFSPVSREGLENGRMVLDKTFLDACEYLEKKLNSPISYEIQSGEYPTFAKARMGGDLVGIFALRKP